MCVKKIILACLQIKRIKLNFLAQDKNSISENVKSTYISLSILLI